MKILNTPKQRFLLVITVPIIVWLIGSGAKNLGDSFWGESNIAELGIIITFALGLTVLLALMMLLGVIFLVSMFLYMWVMGKPFKERSEK